MTLPIDKTEAALKTVSPLMISKLVECRRRLLAEGEDHVTLEYFGMSFSGLYKRHLVEVKYFEQDGKKMAGAVITMAGLDYLNKIAA